MQPRLPAPAGPRTGSSPLPQNQLRDLSRVPAVPPDSPEGEKRPNPSGQGLSHTEFHPDFKPASAQPQRPGIAFEVKPCCLRSPAASQLGRRRNIFQLPAEAGMKENNGQMSPGTAQNTALTAPSSLPDLQLAQTGQGVFLSLLPKLGGSRHFLAGSTGPQAGVPSSSSPTALPSALPAQNSQVTDEKQLP